EESNRRTGRARHGGWRMRGERAIRGGGAGDKRRGNDLESPGAQRRGDHGGAPREGARPPGRDDGTL
ncbi:MAG: hypothetical protein AVDCRST_MAG05-357, partial [uncultured Rubrobacteraceae bacterium]